MGCEGEDSRVDSCIFNCCPGESDMVVESLPVEMEREKTMQESGILRIGRVLVFK